MTVEAYYFPYNPTRGADTTVRMLIAFDKDAKQVVLEHTVTKHEYPKEYQWTPKTK